MIFDVEPSQIEKLNSTELVELLRKLLYAEAQEAGISLRGVSVPLQITVADGGEDARVSWEGGNERTDYLPSRFCIFQSKATDPGPAGWKKEVWTKPSQKANAKRELNDAVKETIAKNGSYIGFTSAALVGSKYDDRIVAIKDGIQYAGADPNQLKAIDIYDANKIAGWASKYPSIAVWLNEKQSGLTLKGFQTIGRLGKKADFVSIEQVEDKASRFIIENTRGNELTFDKVKERIINELNDSKKSIRVIGPSGVGKTRFVYEVFKDETTTAKIILTTSVIYCDFRDISNHLFQIVQSLSDTGNPALIIVDECSREDAIRLGAIVEKEGSKLRIITIGNDNQAIPKDNCLNIFVELADDELIEGIIRKRYPKADYSDIHFIKQLSGGYPRIAILATDNYLDGFPILKSVEDVVNRILTGSGIKEVEQIRAIECLALFDELGADENFSYQIDFVAKNLARQTGDEMYEHLAYAANSSLVDRRGIFFKAQPIPIAAFLGSKRLDLLRVNTILNFIETASPELRRSFLNQWCYFDNSRTATKVTQWLLSRNGWCGSLEQLKTEIGSQCLKAIVHIEPDEVANVIRYAYGDLSIDELNREVINKRGFVEILIKLVARKKTFYMIAPILMRLSVIDNNESYLPNAKSSFKQLFQLHLSGTEAEPAEKFVVLDQGISSGDEKIILSCIEALKNTLKRNYFGGSVISHQIGNKLPPKEWKPTLWSEVFEFHRNGLQRLMRIRSAYKCLAKQCESIIASNLRSLLCESLFSDIENITKEIMQEKGVWFEAIEKVGDWLYFDRKKASEDFSRKTRKLYDDLFPTDPIQKAILYTKFSSANIRNPDLNYDIEDQSSKDFEYSSRQAKELAAEIAINKDLTNRAIQTMIRERLDNVFPFTHELAIKLKDPIKVFQFAINEFEASNDKQGIQFLRGFLSGIDKRDPEIATQCLQIALNSYSLKEQVVDLYLAVNISIERLNEIIKYVKEGTIPAKACVYFSYGRGLNNLKAKDILPLINELLLNQGSDGLWAAIEIIIMYQDDQKELNHDLIDNIKQIITSQELLQQEQSRTGDGHLFESLIFLIHEHCGIDDQLAIGLSEQIVKLCKIEEYGIFSNLDSYFQQIIKLLVTEKPIILWKTLSQFFEIATPLEVNLLERLTGIPSNIVDSQSHNRAGILFGIPYDECKKWAEVYPEIRSPFLCSFYPVIEIETTASSELVPDLEASTLETLILDIEKVQQYRWHPELERLTKDFGHVKEFREALYDRLPPRSWWGSMIPYLEIYLIPLETWFTHPVPEMANWARDVHRSLENQIEQEQERDQERRI